MSEVERLRALLAEAREWVVGVQGHALRDRIDAALAEPVGACANCTAANLEGARLIEQRDLARAEVERLRTSWKWDAIKAYKRGAQAMREAAAKHLECPPTGGWVLPSAWKHEPCERCERARAVRALPIPEDKANG